MATDARGNLYVVDAGSQKIKKFSPEGRPLFAFGTVGVPKGNDEADGKWTAPSGVAVDSKGNIYVSDSGNSRIEKYDAQGKFLVKWGVQGAQDSQFSKPGVLAVDKQDRLYVADVGNNRVQRFRFEAQGAPVYDGQWGGDGHEPGQFDRPYGLCLDKDGNSYVADFGNHRVQKFDPSGRLIYTLGKFGAQDGEFDSPVAVAVDGSGALFVGDWGNNRIEKFGP